MQTSRNIPINKFENLFLEDPVGELFWRYWMGPRFDELRHHFVALGEAGALATPLSARADKENPQLVNFDPAGERIDRVIHHPDYHRLEELSYGRGIVAIKYDPAFLSKYRDVRHLVGFATSSYFGETEMGLYCPICMTDGVARVLERHALSSHHGETATAAREALKHLTTRDMKDLWQGSMYLTEKQGGSDVGANTVQATEENGRWFLTGDKWFCSNVAADAILALARMPHSLAGTKGLGLFLVLRQRPVDNTKTIRIHRLKDKLGVRSMATGEVSFEHTEAFLIGGEGEGFKQMADMLNLSRLYNAVASTAVMRRAILEASAYGRERQAFGRPLAELPLWSAAMSDLQAEYWASFAFVFETVRLLDASDSGDVMAGQLSRLCIPMAKALLGKLAVFTTSECMEQIAGNGYIEENILPRLLRDAQVLPIWEGSTNVLCLDVVRVLQKEKAQEVFWTRIEKAIAKAQPDMRRFIEQRVQLGKSMAIDEKTARQWIETNARTFALALLAEASTHTTLQKTCSDAFDRLKARPYFTAPLCS